VIALVDTNILLRVFDRGNPAYGAIRGAIRKLRADGWTMQAASQNFIEFWNVATRPRADNGLGMDTARAERLLRRLERLFPGLPDTAAIYEEWRRIVVAFRVAGVKAHDARLVAAMRIHGISHIVTLNPGDFARYSPSGIVSVDPHTVAATA
jgi:predicted nucleic acid-binding protein